MIKLLTTRGIDLAFYPNEIFKRWKFRLRPGWGAKKFGLWFGPFALAVWNKDSGAYRKKNTNHAN
jgi:hypothetical protein